MTPLTLQAFSCCQHTNVWSQRTWMMPVHPNLLRYLLFFLHLLHYFFIYWEMMITQKSFWDLSEVVLTFLKCGSLTCIVTFSLLEGSKWVLWFGRSFLYLFILPFYGFGSVVLRFQHNKKSHFSQCCLNISLALTSSELHKLILAEQGNRIHYQLGNMNEPGLLAIPGRLCVFQ